MLIMSGMLMLIGGAVFYKLILGQAVYLFKDIGRSRSSKAVTLLQLSL